MFQRVKWQVHGPAGMHPAHTVGDDRLPSLCPGQLLAGAVSSVRGEPGHACTSPWTPLAASLNPALLGGGGNGLALLTACEAGPRGPISAQTLRPRVRLLWTQLCQVRHCQGAWAVLVTPAKSTRGVGTLGRSFIFSEHLPSHVSSRLNNMQHPENRCQDSVSSRGRCQE